MSERGEARTVNTSVRIPADLHERVKRQAERQDRSVSSLLVHYARRGVVEDERAQAREEGEQS